MQFSPPIAMVAAVLRKVQSRAGSLLSLCMRLPASARKAYSCHGLSRREAVWSESLALLGTRFFLGGPAFLLPGGDTRAGFLAELPGGFGGALLALGLGLGKEGFGWAAAAFGGRGVVPSAEQGACLLKLCDFAVDEGEDVGVLRHRGPGYGMGGQSGAIVPTRRIPQPAAQTWATSAGWYRPFRDGVQGAPPRA